MKDNKFYEQLISYMGEPVNSLEINQYIHGFLSGYKPKVYYKLEAQKPYITVSFKASSPDLGVKMINVRIYEELKVYGESKAQTDDFIFPELFKSFDAEKHSPTGYVYTYLFPVTVSEIYLLLLSLEGLNTNECLFALKADYLY